MAMAMRACLALVLCLLCAPNAYSASSPVGRVNVVLLGATGNLAEKYLWKSLYNLLKQDAIGPDVVIYPASVSPAERGQTKIDGILSRAIDSCRTAADGDNEVATQANADRDCRNFLKHVKPYVQLKTAEHYSQLQRQITSDLGNTKELGRVVYCSIPPSAYGPVAGFVHDNLRPYTRPSPNSDTRLETVGDDKPWLRVVFEKPFGSDSRSASALLAQLESKLYFNEVYLVDHYMGKTGVMALDDFRQHNHQYDYLLNGDHVESVTIVMTETEDCKGRAGYFDKYGIIRDVFQNHLSEMLALITHNIEAGEFSRRELLQHVRAPGLDDVVLGQYKDYAKHVHEDHRAWGQDTKADSTTPTYAAVRLFIDDTRWAGVPFYLAAGKVRPKRETYVRIKFKQEVDTAHRKELFFMVQDNGVPGDITADDSLPDFQPPRMWHMVKPRHATPEGRHPNAYETLVHDVFMGSREHFVDVEELMVLWNIWTPLVDLLEQPLELIKYDKDTDLPVQVGSNDDHPHDNVHLKDEL